jgi:hypothetical protein
VQFVEVCQLLVGVLGRCSVFEDLAVEQKMDSTAEPRYPMPQAQMTEFFALVAFQFKKGLGVER